MADLGALHFRSGSASLDVRNKCQANKYRYQYPQALPAIGLGCGTDEAATTATAAATTAAATTAAATAG